MNTKLGLIGLVGLGLASCSKDAIEDVSIIPPVVEITETVRKVVDTTQVDVSTWVAPVTAVASATSVDTQQVTNDYNCTDESQLFIDGENYTYLSNEIYVNELIENVNTNGIVNAIEDINNSNLTQIIDELQSTPIVIEREQFLNSSELAGYAMPNSVCAEKHIKLNNYVVNDNDHHDYQTDLFIHELAHAHHYDLDNDLTNESESLYELAMSTYPNAEGEYWTMNFREFIAEVVTSVNNEDNTARKLYDNIEEIRSFVDNNFVN